VRLPDSVPHNSALPRRGSQLSFNQISDGMIAEPRNSRSGPLPGMRCIRDRRAVDQARRHLLTIAAGGAVAAAIPTAVLAAAPTVDPVFDRIGAHRKAHAAHLRSLNLQNRFERRFGIGEGTWISEKPCHEENDAFEKMVTTPATTLPGLIATLAYFEELASEFETEWMLDERACPSVLVQSFAASLKNIGVRP
jgi:hypothetical protein